jgi:co-chaperonin GroES (HSP10)
MEVMHDRVLLKKIEPEKKTASGFYIYSVDESDKATDPKLK